MNPSRITDSLPLPCPSPRFGRGRSLPWLVKSLLLGAGASFLVVGGDAQAVETIRLVNNATSSTAPAEINWSLEEVRTFVRTGGLRQPVRDFLNSSNQEPGILQRAFTRQVEVPANLGIDFLDTSLGQLMLNQLVGLIQSADPLPNLRTSLRASIQDDRKISLIELLENYPTETVTLNITGLVRTYDSIVAIVNRLMPILESARETVQGVVCRCEQPAPDRPRSSLPDSLSSTKLCDDSL